MRLLLIGLLAILALLLGVLWFRDVPLAGRVLFPEGSDLTGRLAEESLAQSMRGELRALQGRSVARANCAGCHLFPEPTLLPKEAWPPVLRNMAARMGASHLFKEVEQGEKGLLIGLRQGNELRPQPDITAQQWLRVTEYYYRRAPAVLPPLARSPVVAASKHFRLLPLMHSDGQSATDVTMVEARPGLLYVGSLSTSPEGAAFALRRFVLRRGAGAPSALEVAGSSGSAMAGAPVALRDFGSNKAPPRSALALLGGPPSGQGGQLAEFPNGRQLFQTSERIADLQSGRFGADAALVVSVFGVARGGAFLLDGRGARELLRARGVVQTALADFDLDGLGDVAVLSAQDRESLQIVYARQEGDLVRPMERRQRGVEQPESNDLRTRPTTVVEKDPTTGFTGLVAGDFDGDGRVDLAVVNGDNGDFVGNVPKPYHGLSIWQNRSDGFYETFRFPLYGACRAVVADFDKDGRLDLMVSALYAPKSAAGGPAATFAREQLILLWNRGGAGWQPERIDLPAGFRAGVLSIADIDGDGDPDAVVGSLPYLSEPSGDRRPLAAGVPAVLILENLKAAVR